MPRSPESQHQADILTVEKLLVETAYLAMRLDLPLELQTKIAEARDEAVLCANLNYEKVKALWLESGEHDDEELPAKPEEEPDRE